VSGAHSRKRKETTVLQTNKVFQPRQPLDSSNLLPSQLFPSDLGAKRARGNLQRALPMQLVVLQQIRSRVEGPAAVAASWQLLCRHIHVATRIVLSLVGSSRRPRRGWDTLEATPKPRAGGRRAMKPLCNPSRFSHPSLLPNRRRLPQGLDTLYRLATLIELCRCLGVSDSSKSCELAPLML